MPRALAEPRIAFALTPDGAHVAWASAGEGPPLVMVPGWLSHVKRLWSHPAAASALAQLAERHRFIWYDRVGGGLSDRSRLTESMDDDLGQLKAVLDAAEVDRCRLIGYSVGGPVATRFAVAAPERVEHLVLYSTYARGADLGSDEAHDGLVGLITANWKLASLALSSLFLPNGSSEDLAWFTRFQRDAAAPEMAAALLVYLRCHDVSADLPRVRVPTTVLANRHDPAVRTELTREVARLVPGAHLQMLEGSEHDPFIRDSGEVVPAILAAVEGRPFIASRPPPTVTVPLTARETDVLTLLGQGASNKDIARQLGVQPSTVERHVTNLYRKLGANGRADAAVHAVARRLVSLPR
jgi:pimeloyl-ACP methyl ester carboxylesterase/DNA-binding CsgD family transcriptional regulator